MSELWPGRGGPAIDYISPAPSARYCAKKRRSTVILGSTGSIGRTAIEIMARKPDAFCVAGLACAKNVELLASQANTLRPPMLAVLNEEAKARLKPLLQAGYQPQIACGSAGYAQMASMSEADLVVGAQVGAAGLPGVLAAALAGKIIALANKESLVLAGSLLRRICARTGASILPLDSEHYAVFQCVAGRGQTVAAIILTASGGPFLGLDASRLTNVKAVDALKHPTWSMGNKITIDSATLMNKGLEVIEAMHLYGLQAPQVEVVVHPQSVVHSFARFADNSLLAQFAVPDMRLPVANCLLWPECKDSFIKPVNLAALGELAFKKPDRKNFPCLGLAEKAMQTHFSAEWAETGINPACIILNAANEAAVELFLNGQCGFCDIPAFIEAALLHLPHDKPQSGQPADSFSRQAQEMYSVIARLDAESRKYVRERAGI